MNQCLWCHEKIKEMVTFSNLLYRNISPTHLCKECRGRLKAVSQEMKKCAGCEKMGENNLCLDCTNWKKAYPAYAFKHHSLYYYNDFAKEFMEKYKVMGDCVLSAMFAHELRAKLLPLSKQSLIIPIPISQHSKETRGFNQVELLLESAGIPFTCCLENKGVGEKQARKNKGDRMRMQQPFVVKQEKTPLISGASIIVVDDLYTTGRTLFHAADVLNAYSPNKVETYSLFR